jgi:hypothetical protein
MAINGTTIAQVPRPESQAATHHPSGLVPCPYCTSVFPGVLSFLPQPVSWIQSLFYFTSNLIQASLVSLGALLLSVVWGPAPSVLLRTSLEMQRPRLHPRPSSRESESAL